MESNGMEERELLDAYRVSLNVGKRSLELASRQFEIIKAALVAKSLWTDELQQRLQSVQAITEPSSHSDAEVIQFSQYCIQNKKSSISLLDSVNGIQDFGNSFSVIDDSFAHNGHPGSTEPPVSDEEIPISAADSEPVVAEATIARPSVEGSSALTLGDALLVTLQVNPLDDVGSPPQENENINGTIELEETVEECARTPEQAKSRSNSVVHNGLVKPIIALENAQHENTECEPQTVDRASLPKEAEAAEYFASSPKTTEAPETLPSSSKTVEATAEPVNHEDKEEKVEEEGDIAVKGMLTRNNIRNCIVHLNQNFEKLLRRDRHRRITAAPKSKASTELQKDRRALDNCLKGADKLLSDQPISPVDRVEYSDTEMAEDDDCADLPSTSKKSLVRQQAGMRKMVACKKPASRLPKSRARMIKNKKGSSAGEAADDSDEDASVGALNVDEEDEEEDDNEEEEDEDDILSDASNEGNRRVTRSQRIDKESRALLNKRIALISSDEEEEKEEDGSDVEESSPEAEGVAKNVARKRKLVSSDDSDDKDKKAVNSSSDSEHSNATDESALSKKNGSPTKRGRKTEGKKPRSKKVAKPKKKKHRVAVDSDDEIECLSEHDSDKDQEGDRAVETSAQRSFRSRKIISKAKLAQETIDAEKAEKERKQRLKAKQMERLESLRSKQKEYNDVEITTDVNSGEPILIASGSKFAALKFLCLDEDCKEGNDELSNPVTVHPSLVRVLKQHQADGIQFMYDCVFESLSQSKVGGGGILAHCMGLGKTLQVIAFLHTIMMHNKLSELVRRVLVVAPKNVVTNWNREFCKWLGENDPELDEIEIYELSDAKDIDERLERIKHWHNSKTPAVLIIGYSMFRILTGADADKPVKKRAVKTEAKPKPKSKKQKREEKLKTEIAKYLQEPGPDMVVCDEGHMLKSEDTAISRAMSKIATRRRICITGTPLQNNLIEYYTMVNFVKPGLLGTKYEYANRFANIIKRGQTKDASDYEVRCMRKRCHILYNRLSDVVMRRDYRVLVSIPPKQEYVLNVSLNERQIKLYNEFLKGYVDSDQVTRRRRLLADYHIFARIWTHPYLLLIHEEESERKRQLEEEDDFVVSENDTPESGEDSCDDIIIEDDIDKPSSSYQPGRITRQSKNHGETLDEFDDPERPETPPELKGWFSGLNLISDADKEDFSLSHKLLLLEQIIKNCEACGDKLLVFTQSLESLRLIRRMLEHFARENLWFIDGHSALMAEQETWSWVDGKDFLVIDGSLQVKNRDFVQEKFNDPLNLRARLMLISTKAGSLGTNLVAANRVVIFDACWNPSHDTQALFRVYRYGQNKPVYIYRFIAQGTMEQRIYNRQVTKESTAKRVTEEAQIQRHFDGHDLDELYKFDPKEMPKVNESSSTSVPRLAPPKDRLLADLIISHGYLIESYREHDSLFDNVEDEKLTEAEREEAWLEYEREKESRPQINRTASGATATTATSAISMQQRIQSELAGHLAGATNSPLYRQCFVVREMNDAIARQVYVIKRFLDLLLPRIPFNLRGGLHEFNTYFTTIIKEAVDKNHDGPWLLHKAISAFRTAIQTVHSVESCTKTIDYLRMIAPALFDFDQIPIYL